MLLGRRSREKPMQQETKSETNRHKWQNGNCDRIGVRGGRPRRRGSGGGVSGSNAAG